MIIENTFVQKKSMPPEFLPITKHCEADIGISQRRYGEDSETRYRLSYSCWALTRVK